MSKQLERVYSQLLTFCPSPLTPPSIQGLLTGVVSAARMVTPQEWFHLIFNNPNQASPSDDTVIDNVSRILLTEFKAIGEALSKGQFEPYFGKEVTAENQRFWCEGYVAGVSIGGFPEDNKKVLYELMTPFVLLANPAEAVKTAEHIAAKEDRSKEEVLEELYGLALEHLGDHIQGIFNQNQHHLHHHAHKEQHGPAQNPSPQIGRNDPCPCGSGKKFKHCHGKG